MTTSDHLHQRTIAAIRAVARNHGYTQGRLAAPMGYSSPQVLARAVNASNTVSCRFIGRWLDACGAGIEEFLGEMGR